MADEQEIIDVSCCQETCSIIKMVLLVTFGLTLGFGLAYVFLQSGINKKSEILFPHKVETVNQPPPQKQKPTKRIIRKTKKIYKSPKKTNRSTIEIDSFVKSIDVNNTGLRYLAITSGVNTNQIITYIPSLKSIGLQLRWDFGFGNVSHVEFEDISRGYINNNRNINHLFEVMDLYLTLTNASCTSMHRFLGYDGTPKKLVSVNLGHDEYDRFIHMINPEIIEVGEERFDSEFYSEMCDKKIQVSGPMEMMVRFTTSDSIIKMYDDNSKGATFSTRPKIHTMFFEKTHAICVQRVMKEFEGTETC